MQRGRNAVANQLVVVANQLVVADVDFPAATDITQAFISDYPKFY